MTKQKSIGWRQLVAAGFTVHQGYGRKWYKVTAPDGEAGHVLRQSANKWHWFSDQFEATASGHTPQTCQKGGLGDALGTNGEVRSYENMLLGCPNKVLTECAAAYRASSDTYNSVTPERRRKYTGS